MAFWQTITEIAARAACDTGKAVADNDIFSMARVGTIRVGAVIRNDSAALEWFYPDGTRVGAQSITSDGVARWLDTFKLERLALHGRVTLAGLCWQVAGGTTLIAGPKSPFITADDIRIPSTEYPRILASLKGEPIEPRTQTGGEPTPPQATLKHGEALITKWQALAARVAALQDQDLPPTEQEAADRVLSGLNAEIKALNASKAFQSSVTSHLARLEATRKGGCQHDMIETEIAGWRALLLDAAENEGRETNTTGLVRWQAAIYENAEEIIEMYPSLSARNLMTWCKKHGPRDVFGVAQPNQETLGWIDSAKKPQTVSYKRISNLLTDARNAGIFPPKK